MLQAFGMVPGFEGTAPSADGWHRLREWPGLWTSVSLTLRTGLFATATATLSALLIGLGGGRWTQRVVAPLLVVPHAALAVGLAFLIAPTGWLVRLAGLPPLGFATVGDRFGAAIVLALWIKETPFLLLCVTAALDQAQAERSRLVAASLGYAPLRAAWMVVLPRVWPQLRWPVLAVLAFSLSVVDVALLLGPQTPPTLAVQILRWSSDPDLSRWPQAAAASLLLTAMVVASFVAFRGVELGTAWIGGRAARKGVRGRARPGRVAAVVASALAVLGTSSLATLLLWAGAGSWRFPSEWPSGFAVGAILARVRDLGGPAWTTLWLGMTGVALALLLAIAVLRAGGVWRGVWVPLLLPQAGFLFGVQIVLVAIRLDGSVIALVWSHLLFVLPYVVLALAGPWRAVDDRYRRAAASLGASPRRVLVRVTLPLLARPLLAAGAIGFGVSVTLYLPTVFAGAGRVTTLATEAVSLASGADRRLLAAAALAQAALPALVFAGAFASRPRWR